MEDKMRSRDEIR